MLLALLLIASTPSASSEFARLEAELAAVQAKLPDAVDSWDPALERSEEDRARWKSRLQEQLSLWTAWRDARCNPRLLAYEGRHEEPEACRLRIMNTILEDFRYRFDLGPGARRRASIEETVSAPEPPRSAEEEGPCAHAPPVECDYCGMNRCWERRLRDDDARLNAAWRSALAKIRSKRDLTTAAKEDWTARLRAVQRLWLKWRDESCELEAWETPNPYAHSIYALVTAPCLDVETEARTAALRRDYGR